MFQNNFSTYDLQFLEISVTPTALISNIVCRNIYSHGHMCYPHSPCESTLVQACQYIFYEEEGGVEQRRNILFGIHHRDFLLSSMISLVSAKGTPQAQKILVAHVGLIAYAGRTISIELIREHPPPPPFLLNLFLDHEITGVDVHRKSPSQKKERKTLHLRVFSTVSSPPLYNCNCKNIFIQEKKRIKYPKYCS